MASLSKERVMEAINRQQQQPPKRERMIDRLKGMLNPRSGPGALAHREEYLRYVEQRQAAGQEAVDYDTWARQYKGR